VILYQQVINMRLLLAGLLLMATVPLAAAELPPWRAVWVWSVPLKTESDLIRAADQAQSLGFNVLLMYPPKDKVAFMTAECHRRGMQLYLSTVFSGGDRAWQQVMTPAQEARAGKPFAADYQIGGEPVRPDEVLSSPLPCFSRPEVREWGANKVRELAALGADGLAFDMIGYCNYTRCHCAVCEQSLAAYRRTHLQLSPDRAERRWAQQVLVDFNNDLAAVARQTHPGIGLTTHVYPVFLPHPYYGYRLKVDYVGETVAWFFKPHWPLSSVQARIAEVVARQGSVYHTQRAAPFIGFDARQRRNYRSTSRLRAELQAVCRSGAEGLQVAELGYLLQRPLIAHTVAEVLGGTYCVPARGNP
jgi:uncharacterized lipoprotein YddW (UPF0748 family)